MLPAPGNSLHRLLKVLLHQGLINFQLPVQHILLIEQRLSAPLPLLPHAVGLSKALGSRIKLLRVTHEDRVDADERDHLLRIAERLNGEGVADVTVEVLNGDPATAIVEYIDRSPDCLVAMTTHGRTGLGRWTLGSVTDRVVRHSAAPVLVLRSTH